MPDESEGSPLLHAVEAGPADVVQVLRDVIRGVAVWPGHDRTPDIATIMSEYECSLGVDGREIVRDAIVLLIEQIARRDADHTDPEISDVVHLASQLDVPGHRTQRTCARLEHAWRLCAVNDARHAAVRVLGLLAERGPTRPDEVWLDAFGLLGSMSTVVVFRGLNRNGIAGALRWLDSVADGVELDTVLAAVVPLVIKEYGLLRTKEAFDGVQSDLSSHVAVPIQRRVDLEIARSYVGPQARQGAEARMSAGQAGAGAHQRREGPSRALLQVARELDRDPGIGDFDEFDQRGFSPLEAINGWLAAAPETVEDADGRGLVRRLRSVS
jgi:hypothetical protein